MSTLWPVRVLVVIALAGASLVGTGAAASATHEGPSAPTHAQVMDACRDTLGALPVGPGACRGVEQLLRVGAQACRFAADRQVHPFLDPAATCSLLDGKAYSIGAMRHFEDSWVHEALTLQGALDDSVPLLDALIPATHNSFNSAAYYPTLSGLDHNQVASMTDQLRMGMRGLEIDLHRFPSPYADPDDNGFAPIMCHGTTTPPPSPPVHVGCTGERHMREGLAELATWLDAHPDQVILLYLENQLDNDVAMHDAAAAAIDAELGGRVFRPTSTCADMPTALSEDDVTAAGKQVVIVGNCTNAHTGWGSWVHLRGPAWDEDKSAVGDDYLTPTCQEDPSLFRRWYEDSTWLSHTVQPTGLGSPGEITAAETARMVECGVNLLGFDQLVPGDPRLEALIWSWATGQPGNNGGAAVSNAQGRFRAVNTTVPHAFACRTSSGWAVTAATGQWHQAAAACTAEFPGSTFAVPATGRDNAALVAAKAAAGVGEVWLNYASIAGKWVPNP